MMCDDSLCTLCPRECNVNRLDNNVGYCHVPNEYMIGRIAPHYYEEPCISGVNGSGAIFFSGCNMGCIYCQNAQLSKGKVGRIYSEEELIDAMLKLQSEGCHNINLVTPSHYANRLATTLRKARERSLTIPIVYNTSAYEKVDTLKLLDGLIDIYLPDYKYHDSYGAKKYSKAADYPEIAQKAIEEMVRQIGNFEFTENAFVGDDDNIDEVSENCLMKRGIIVRHLVLPNRVNQSKEAIKYLYDTYGDKIFLSIMNQYTPFSDAKNDPDLCRTVTEEEYNEVIDYAISLGLENAFIQEGETQSESFIPEFS